MKKLPPLHVQAGHYVHHLFLKAKTFAAGQDMSLPEKDIERRLRICAECPHRVDTACGLCGCPLEEKAIYPFQYCDDGRWPDDENQQQQQQETE